MSDELFPPREVAMDSPRLRWLRKHGLVLQHNAGLTRADYEDGACDWTCYVQAAMHGGVCGDCNIGGGDTEDEACADLAKNKGLKLWNEESP